MTPEEKREYNRESQRKWRAANPDKAREKHRKWTAANPGKQSEADRKYRLAHPEKKREMERKWRVANREKCRAQTRRWRAAHPERRRAGERAAYAVNAEKRLETARKWRAAHLEQARETKRRWKDRHPEKVGIERSRRRAARAAAPGSHTAEDIVRLYEAQGGKCAACRAGINKAGKGRYHVDHVQPLRPRDGRAPGSNGPENLQLLCGPCNMTKHNMDSAEWAARIGRLFV